jgi:CubicO group peptidase (beta-lactamase class C family)
MMARAKKPRPRPRASELLLGLLLASCTSSKPSEPDLALDERPAPEDPKVVRKRECVAALTSDADPRIHTVLRSICAEAIEHDVPGIAFALVEPGKPPITAEYGVRCFGEPDPIEPSTAFRIGSVSKPITAALALGLVAEGKLALTDDATRIPGFEPQAELPPPQLEALLGHRSGLGPIVAQGLVESEGAWLPALARSPAAGAVGEHHYNNAGYSLIGAMIEQASGRSYAELIAERVRSRLELDGLTTDPAVAGAACGHLVGDPQLRPIPTTHDLDFMPGNPAWMVPAGGVLSSATDLARFGLAIATEQLPGTEVMLTELGVAIAPAFARAGHHDERYGLGLRSWEIQPGRRAYGHAGNNFAFVAQLVFVPEVGAIAILANRGVELPATMAAADVLLASL